MFTDERLSHPAFGSTVSSKLCAKKYYVSLDHFQSCRASSHINVKYWSPPTKAEVPKEVAANLKECDVIGRDVLSAFVARVEDGVAARVRHEPVDRRTQRA